MVESLTLKWGTLKSWNLGKDTAARALFKQYCELGISCSAMAQRDTAQQVEIICNMIDAVDGDIWNDWEGTRFATKEAAKKYVREYND